MTSARYEAAPRRIRLMLALVALATSACGGTLEPGDAPDPTLPAPASPRATASDPVGASPDARPTAPARAATDVPSRVVIDELGIDLPVLSGDLRGEGSAPDYPLCDVAQYLTTYRYPGRPGTTTWVYAHAREGMFLPLLTASHEADGASLIGQEVIVFSTAPRRYRYVVTDVNKQSTDRLVARGVPADEGRLVLQTSEGPAGTVPKLQIVARLTATEDALPADALPVASPRAC